MLTVEIATCICSCDDCLEDGVCWCNCLPAGHPGRADYDGPEDSDDY